MHGPLESNIAEEKSISISSNGPGDPDLDNRDDGWRRNEIRHERLLIMVLCVRLGLHLMPTNQASSFRKPQGSTTNAKFALVITRDSLDSKDRLEIISRSTNAPRDQLSVPCLLFLHYLQTLARLDLPLWHQWRDYRHLSNFVHLRFINLGPEERSYRQMFFVFKSNDTASTFIPLISGSIDCL